MSTERLILFVHGLGGNAEATWGMFPQLVKEDPDLHHCTCATFSFPTKLWMAPWSKSSPPIQLLSDALETQLRIRYSKYPRVAIVGHSLGGLIARKYLVDQQRSGRPTNVDRLLLYATPNNGSSLANVGKIISWWHPQLRALCRNSGFIGELATQWEEGGLENAYFVRYVVGAMDAVVSPESARRAWGGDSVDTIADCGHRDIVKPAAQDDLRYQVLQTFILRDESIGAADADISQFETPSIKRFKFRGGNQEIGGQYPIIGFDLDGTLVRGLEFSWTKVWDYLDFPEAVRKEGMRRYLKRETSYDEWCRWACEQFRTRGLNRSDFKEITHKLRPTAKYRDALKILRSDGRILAIVSGGIDVFIDECLPDARELFDYIFINRIAFDDQGIICGVEPTPFDFEGKASALLHIANEHGLDLRDVAFVGEGFNDAAVARQVGLSIAYPPTSYGMRSAADQEVTVDDLTQVLPYLMAGG